MKKVMRLSCIVMALLMALAVFAGCSRTPAESGTSKSGSTPSSGDSSKDDTYAGTALDNIEKGLFDFGGMTITLADPYNHNLTPGLSEATDRLIERIALLKENWNVNFKFETIDADAYWDNMVTAVMGGNPYGDIMFAFPWMMTDWIAGGAPRDLKPVIDELGLDLNDGTYTRMVINDNTIGNKIFGLARGYNKLQYSLIYNPKMFANKGLEDPNALIEKGAKWDFDTLRDYAQKLTEFNTDGDLVSLGLTAAGTRQIMASFVLSNGGQFIKFDADGMPSFALNDAKGLEALKYFEDMAYTDKSFTSMDWQDAADQLLNGKVGMYICEEWVAEYIQQTAAENAMDDSYALTYFPKGPQGTEFLDVSYGGNSYWIPSTIDAERAKAALACYCALYFPRNDVSKADAVMQRAEELFADEASAKVYQDIVMNDRARSAGFARMGLNEILGYVSEDLMLGVGTPQSVLGNYEGEIAGLLQDSGYVSVLKGQQ